MDNKNQTKSYFVFSYRLTIGGTSEHEYGFHTSNIEEAYKHTRKCLEESNHTATVVITKFIS